MVQLKSHVLQELNKTCRILIRKYKLEDMIIFGSALKGKSRPSDIDIAIIIDEKKNNIEKISQELSQLRIDLHITKINPCNLLMETRLWSTLIHEGFSVKKQRFLSEMFNLRPMLLFQYELKDLDKIKKQAFCHALYGTGGRESFLDTVKGEKIGRNSVLVPVSRAEEMRSFLETWDLIYKLRRIYE